jgi:hypothetical protein
MGLFPPHFSQIGKGFINIPIFKEKNFVSLILYIGFLVSVSFILAQFYYFFPSTNLGFGLFLFF